MRGGVQMSVQEYINANAGCFAAALKKWIAIPSISSDPVRAGDVARSARWPAQHTGRAKRVARLLQAGEEEINGPPANLDALLGGMKRSGHGRGPGPDGIEEFLAPKAIHS